MSKDDLLYGRVRRTDPKGKNDRTTMLELVVGIIPEDVRSDDAITMKYVRRREINILIGLEDKDSEEIVLQ